MSNFSIQSGNVADFATGINEGWYTVIFPSPFAEGVLPQVFAQIQTYGGKDTPGLRLQNVSNTGFEVTMAEIYGSNVTSSAVGDLGTVETNGKHPNTETLGWTAIAIG